MFERLQQRWKVGPFQIVLIITCFALGGSLTGYSAKKIIDAFSVEKDWLWTIVYILLVTIIWPLAVLVVSFFFGQFKFFKAYVTRLGRKIGVVGSRQSAVDSRQFTVESSESSQKSDSKLTTDDSRLTTLDSRLPTPDSRLTTHD